MANFTVMHREAAWEACTTIGYSNIFSEQDDIATFWFNLIEKATACSSFTVHRNLTKKNVGTRLHYHFY